MKMVIEIAVRQSRAQRECASSTNATSTHPDHVQTHPKSATQSRFAQGFFSVGDDVKVGDGELEDATELCEQSSRS